MMNGTTLLLSNDNKAEIQIPSTLLLLSGGGGGGGGGADVYLYYQWAVTAWGNSAGWTGFAEMAFYDDLGNLGNLTTANGQLNINGETGTTQSDGGLLSPGDTTYNDMMDGSISTVYIQSRGVDYWPTYIRFLLDTLPSNPILGYTIWAANANYRYPIDFTFEGSNDGTNWTVLDTQTGQTVAAAYDHIDYTLGA